MGIIVDQPRVRTLARRSLSPFDLLRVRRDLIQQLLVREVAQRYRGSYLGLVWAFLTPLLTLVRSEEHTSELQSQSNLVCRLLLEKKKHSLVRPYVFTRRR